MSALYLNAPLVSALPSHFELYGAKTPEQLVIFKAWGFDQAILESNSLIPIANDLGMRVVQANWWNPSTPMSVIESQIANAKIADQLVSVNMMDEPIFNNPSIHPPEDYVELRAKLALFDIPLSLTQYGPKEEWSDNEKALFRSYIHAVDVMRIDPYPVVAKRPLRTVYDWVHATRRMIEEDIKRNIPITVILQAWADGDDSRGQPNLPTPEQLRVMIYLAAFSGADTVSFYNFDPPVWDRFPGFQNALLSYVKEIIDLRTYLSDASINSVFENQHVFRISAVSKDGLAYCIRINTNEMPFGDLSPYQLKDC